MHTYINKYAALFGETQSCKIVINIQVSDNMGKTAKCHMIYESTVKQNLKGPSPKPHWNTRTKWAIYNYKITVYILIMLSTCMIIVRIFNVLNSFKCIK